MRPGLPTELISRQLRAFHLVVQIATSCARPEALLLPHQGEIFLLLRVFIINWRTNSDSVNLIARLATLCRLLMEPVGCRYPTEFIELMPRCRTLNERRKEWGIRYRNDALVAANIVPQAIREFRSQQPDQRIRLFDANLNTILERIETVKFDIGLGIFSKARLRFPFRR
jgi:hypothetical protein